MMSNQLHENKYTEHTDTNECRGMSKSEKNEDFQLISHLKFILTCVFFSRQDICVRFFSLQRHVSVPREYIETSFRFHSQNQGILCAPFFVSFSFIWCVPVSAAVS